MLTRKTVIDDIDVTRGGEVKVTLAIIVLDDADEIAVSYEYRTIVASGTVDEQITAINAKLLQQKKPPIEDFILLKNIVEALVATEITAAGIKVLVHGNSLAAGVGASSAANYWPPQMNAQYPLAGKGIAVENHGVGGQSIFVDAGNGTMIITGPSAIDANLVAGKTNVLLAHEFINEVKVNGFNGNAAHNAWVTYCLARRAAAASAGKKLRIITMTATPAGADPGGGQAAINSRMAGITIANTLMRLNFRSYADILCDVAACEPFATMYANNVWNNAAFIAAGVYARSDGQPDDYTHLGNSGYAVIARAAATAVSWVRH